MTIDTKKLRELAEAAPKDVLDYQRWRESFVAYLFKVHVDGSRSNVGSIDSENLAAFWCAANPQTVIALLDALAAMTAARDEACDIALRFETQLHDMEDECVCYAHPPIGMRIAELRKVGQ